MKVLNDIGETCNATKSIKNKHFTVLMETVHQFQLFFKNIEENFTLMDTYLNETEKQEFKNEIIVSTNLTKQIFAYIITIEKKSLNQIKVKLTTTLSSSKSLQIFVDCSTYFNKEKVKPGNTVYPIDERFMNQIKEEKEAMNELKRLRTEQEKNMKQFDKLLEDYKREKLIINSGS
ncbi:hypothetical protein HDU92_003735 [Lobulomyces angularis]|nr:hypothetical protein HDU92_003735 [Lobulomyces angularis]